MNNSRGKSSGWDNSVYAVKAEVANLLYFLLFEKIDYQAITEGMSYVLGSHGKIW